MSEISYEELRVQLKETKQKLDSREARLRELGVTDWEPRPVKEEKVVIPTCHHIKENGRSCGSAAVTGRTYCHFHLCFRGRRLKMARARARGERWRLELPPLEDLYSVQVGIQQVLDALLRGQLDRRLGGVVLYGLQQAASNLRCPQQVWEQSARFHNVEQVQWDGFEKEHGLPENFDVDTPPDVAFPPPASEPATAPRTVGPQGETVLTEDDIELEELQALQASNPAAYQRRAAQLERKYRRMLERDKEKLTRAHRVVEAARRNEEASRADAARKSPQGAAAEAEAAADKIG